MFRIGITIRGEQRYVTMYSFGYNMFISFLEDNPKIEEEFDKYTTLDYNQEAKTYKNPEIKSYLDKIKKNVENFKARIFHILFMQNQFIGYFITSRVKEKDNIFSRFKYNHESGYIKISQVLVILKFRRLGIAYKMIDRIMEKGNKYVLAADETNLSAVNLYKKLGFIKKAENKYNEILFIKNT